MSYPKRKKNPKSNSRLPRIIMRGQVNSLSKVSKMAHKISCTSYLRWLNPNIKSVPK